MQSFGLMLAQPFFLFFLCVYAFSLGMEKNFVTKNNNLGFFKIHVHCVRTVGLVWGKDFFIAPKFRGSLHLVHAEEG
jgi:hypothetical protein